MILKRVWPFPYFTLGKTNGQSTFAGRVLFDWPNTAGTGDHREALDLNDARRLLIRQAEELFGLFPPES